MDDSKYSSHFLISLPIACMLIKFLNTSSQSARVQFPQRPNIAPQEQPTSNVHEKEIPTQDSLYQKSEADKKNANGQIIPDSR